MNPNEYLQTKEMVNNASDIVETQRSMTVDSIMKHGYNPNKIRTLCNVLINSVDEKMKASSDGDNTSKEATNVESFDPGKLPEETVEAEVTEEQKENIQASVIPFKPIENSGNNSDEVQKSLEEIQEEEEKIKEKMKELVLSFIKSKLETSFDEVKEGIVSPSYVEDPELSKEEEKANIIEDFEDMLSLIESEKSLDEIKGQLDDEASELVDYLNSEEYYDKKMDKNEERKKELEELEKVEGRVRNIRRIKELRQKIAVVDGQWDFSFMKENKKVTVQNTVDVFFDGRRSGYIMQRYYDKCHQINLNADVFRYFMNIEEDNLEEKYHPFNNLFLFHCIRYMSYLDTEYNDIQFRTIVGSLTKLVYDSFPREEYKETFLNTIRTYLDKFIDAGYTDYFIEHNISYPKHPERIKKDEMREESAREYYYKIIENALPDITSPITKEVKAMSIPELAKYAEDVVNESKKKDEEKIEKEFVNNDVNSNDDEERVREECYNKIIDLGWSLSDANKELPTEKLVEMTESIDKCTRNNALNTIKKYGGNEITDDIMNLPTKELVKYKDKVIENCPEDIKKEIELNDIRNYYYNIISSTGEEITDSIKELSINDLETYSNKAVQRWKEENKSEDFGEEKPNAEDE